MDSRGGDSVAAIAFSLGVGDCDERHFNALLIHINSTFNYDFLCELVDKKELFLDDFPVS
jgi:hypothetical protein